MPAQLPVLFVPHGAPTFALSPGAAGAALQEAANGLLKPRAIAIVSAHWDTAVPAVGYAPSFETIHDYWGFPAPLYDLRYPVAGDRAVAEEIRGLLAEHGFDTRLDESRGLDHGAWIPLRTLFPETDIPVVPLSIQGGRGPEYHFRLGEALASLPGKDILLVASGNITHNLRDFQMSVMTGGGSLDYVTQFADWMWEKLAVGDTQAILDYRKLAPSASRAHPSEDHILPLHVALGAAGPGYRAERLYAGVDNRVLAMDGYALWPSGGF